jgi:hypothetical protein
MSRHRATAGDDQHLLTTRAAIALGVVYVIGFAPALILLQPIIGWLDRQADAHREALEAFIAISFVVGGIPPVVMLPFLTVGRAFRVRRTTAPAKRRGADQ